MMRCRAKWFSVVWVFFALCACAQARSALDQVGSVKLGGDLGRRLDAMIERHVLAADVDALTAVFAEKTERGWMWQTEFWGKYMHSAVPYAAYTGSEKLRNAVARGVKALLATQEPSGYIGNYPDELRCGEGWDVWGMKYTMMGLLHYYDATRDADALAACRRLCDYVIAEIGPSGRRGRALWQTGNWSGYASSSILEPVMWLYGRTKDKAYLAFADFIVAGMTEPEAGPRLLDLALAGVSVADRNGHGNVAETHGGYVMKHNRWKAYEMMSCYQGLLEYSEATGRRDLFEAAVKTAGDILREEINLAGGCTAAEAWFHGARKQHLPYKRLQETCVTTTWLRFCGKLLSMTDDPAWADAMERTFYNAYLAAMKPDGSEFAGYTPLSGSRWHGQHHCHMHTDCCTANGPRGFLAFLGSFFRVSDGVATFNFYASAQARGALADGRPVSFEMYSLYPRANTARIVSHTQGVGALPLRLRIPAWSARTRVTLNGKELPGAAPGSYFTIVHPWRHGDVVEIAFDMPVVAHVRERHAAFTRGPVLLARDSRFVDGDLTEPLRGKKLRDGMEMPSFAAVQTPSDDIWMAFSATLPLGAHHENPEGALPVTVFFCDYASAGNTWTRTGFYRTWFPIELSPRE
jgi:DUF1680 family protein